MGREQTLAEKLRRMEQTRQELESLERALGELNPEERLVAEFLLISPEKGNVQRLCEMLAIEQASVYRRRRQVLKKVEQLLLDKTAF